MSRHVEQLELPLPDSRGTVACVSPMHRMTSIPPAPTTRPKCPPPHGLRRPDYRTVDDAPTTVIQEAHHERYVWIRGYVYSGGAPRWKLLASALAHTHTIGLLPSEIPPLDDLTTWALQFRHWGFEGLLRKPS